MQASKRDKLLSQVKVYQLHKAQKEIRGKVFLRLWNEFVKLYQSRFRSQVEGFLSALDEEVLLKKEDSDDVFAEVIAAKLSAAFLVGSRRIGRETSDDRWETSLDLPNTDAAEWAKNRAGRLISSVDDTTKKEVNALISRAIRDGLTRDDTARLIQDQFTDFAKYRAALIATMELGTAYEEGKWVQFDRYRSRFNTRGYKRSQTQGDESVRDSHRENEKDGWIYADEEFSGTKTQRAPHGFNCRCTIIYRLTEPADFVGQRSLEPLIVSAFWKPNLSRFAESVETDLLWDEEIVVIDRALKGFYDRHQKLPKLTAVYGSAPKELLDVATEQQRSIMLGADAFNIIFPRVPRHGGIVFNASVIDITQETYSTLDDLKYQLASGAITRSQYDDFVLRAPRTFSIATEFDYEDRLSVIVMHEMAHFVDYTLRTSSDLAAVSLVRDMDRIVSAYRAAQDYRANPLVLSAFTEYGLINDQEAFAEMYTAYQLSRNDLIDSPEVLELLKSIEKYLQ